MTQVSKSSRADGDGPGIQGGGDGLYDVSVGTNVPLYVVKVSIEASMS